MLYHLNTGDKAVRGLVVESFEAKTDLPLRSESSLISLSVSRNDYTPVKRVCHPNREV